MSTRDVDARTVESMGGERRTIARGDVELSMQVFSGAEPAVVVLHGLAGSGTEFEPTALALRGRKVVLLDQRGHGRSTRRPADRSRAAFVDDVVAVIRAEASEPVDLIGQSMGAHTAMLVAAAHPDLVRRLVLLEVDEGSGSPEEHAALGAWLAAWEVPFATRAQAAEALGGGALARAWAADLEQAPDGLRPRFDADVMIDVIGHVAVPRWDEWGSVTAPTLVVYADGGMFTEGQKRAFVAHNANARRTDLVDASHDAHLDARDAWVDVTSSFLA